MANLKNRMESTLYEMYRKGKGMKRRDDPDNLYIHSSSTLTVYLRETKRFAVWLKEQGVKSRCSDEEAARHIQAYLDALAESGKSENTIHTAAAAVCKALMETGVRMADFDKPRRTSAPQKGRSIPPSLAGRADADATSKEHRRLVEFAKRVGIRRAEYAALLGRDLITVDGDTYVVVEKGKGGKRQLQRIAPEDVEFVKGYFDGLRENDKVFSGSELRNKLNLHALRRQHIQEMYSLYISRMAADPTYRAQLLTEVRAAFERAGEDWRRNPDMRRINSPYICRGSVRRDMLQNGRSIRYDRLALMAVSVFNLAHWRCDVTVANYFR